ncbi:histidinol-phosphate transaminase [Gulosibacter molinativorax]|uniref:Histidinol-phosphate transaminase n=1 Tax=Gulosibacter molinativorax TaxID=256821 RepID=A0ABT7C948_9MICO|nr:histidinol-phosphate transaminase [Gulosibacter molinativorax]MDJ1371739.1 histidinol-phosphate transaminase [Gulosibacter molinativorax]QUY63161.1 Putative phenylalanine aminotransferase [Gulosibacter molinativorax]
MTDAPVKLRAEILAQRAYQQGKPAPANSFKLSSNEVHFPPLESVQKAVTESVITNRYPDASAAAVREALAEHYGVNAENVIVGAGSVSLLYQAVQAAASVGDEVIYPWRSFEAYPGMVTLTGATSVPVALRRDGTTDLDAVLEVITDRTRLIIVCTPNNPTGPVLGQREFEKFMEKVPSDLLVIADEAYIEFVTDPNALNATRLLADYPNLVVARTFSKAYGLAGMRVGYMLGHPEIMRAFNTTAIPFLISAQAQAAALAVMREPEAIRQRVNEISARRDEVRRALLDQGWPVPDAQANFVWLPCGAQTEAVADILREGGIIARAFPGDGIRISIAEEESVTPLLAACWQAIERYPYLRAEERHEA